MTVQSPAPRPSVATAGWALGLAVAGCCFVGNIVSTILARIVLKRSRETGLDHGNGLAVAALAINAVAAGTIGVIVYFAFGLGLAFVDSAYESKAPVNADPRIFDNADVLEPGDCLAVPSLRGGGGSFNRRVSCQRTHDAEVTHKLALTGDRFPGDRVIEREAEQCARQPFRDYVGIPFNSSVLESRYFSPTRQEWDDGDRVIVCLVSVPDQTVDQSLKGSKR